MNWSAALPTFLITLREGVEAALVVGIVLACLKKGGKSSLKPWVYAGISVGIAASAAVGVIFGWMIQGLGSANQLYAPVIEPLAEAIFSIAAIIMLSWMLVWMTQQARYMKTEVEGAIHAALKAKQAGWGVFTLIFIAVLREGFESVLFVVSKLQQGLIPALGALAGLGSAAAIGVLLFKWGIKLNLRLFFQVMGVFLLLIISGLVVSSLGLLDEAVKTFSQISRQSENLCFYYERFTKNPSCILGPLVWDLSHILPEEGFPGLLLSALFGYTQRLFQVQAVGYILFAATLGSLYFQSLLGKIEFRRKISSRVGL